MAESLRNTVLNEPGSRNRVLADCLVVIDEEVRSKSGVSGLAIKGAFKVIKKVKPGIIREAMDALLDPFMGRLEPFWDGHLKAGKDPATFAQTLPAQAAEVSEALLGITDDRAKNAKNKTIKSTYNKLRPKAQEHVQAAIPRVSKMIDRHIQAAPAANA